MEDIPPPMRPKFSCVNMKVIEMGSSFLSSSSPPQFSSSQCVGICCKVLEQCRRFLWRDKEPQEEAEATTEPINSDYFRAKTFLFFHFPERFFRQTILFFWIRLSSWNMLAFASSFSCILLWCRIEKNRLCCKICWIGCRRQCEQHLMQSLRNFRAIRSGKTSTASFNCALSPDIANFRVSKLQNCPF